MHDMFSDLFGIWDGELSGLGAVMQGLVELEEVEWRKEGKFLSAGMTRSVG